MVTASLSGGIGNRLFQMAAAIGHALDHDTTYCFPHADMGSVDLFKIIRVPVRISEQIAYYYNDQLHGYRKIPFHRDMCLNGYFQSERYFENHKDAIYDRLKLPDQLSSIHNTVSVHVRRGDYLSHPDLFCDLWHTDFYKKAIRHFVAMGYKDFVFFSDDIVWCEKKFTAEYFGADRFYYSSYTDPVKDLIWMAECRHHIIANSTFSWWGAWIGEMYKNAIVCEVVAPENWFTAKSGLSSADLIPARWTVI